MDEGGLGLDLERMDAAAGGGRGGDREELRRIWKGRGGAESEGKKGGGGWMENDHRTELGFRGHIHVWCRPLDPGDPTVIYP